jgi:hypothetical protein
MIDCNESYAGLKTPHRRYLLAIAPNLVVCLMAIFTWLFVACLFPLARRHTHNSPPNALAKDL